MELRPVPRRRGPRRCGRLWLAGAAAVLCTIALLEMLPTALGLQRYVVTTDAMGDSLPRGSLVVAREVVRSDLSVGDVITFASPKDDRLVTRRVTAVFTDRVATGGDASGPDPWVLPRDTVSTARMLFHIPLVGYPFMGEVGRWLWLVAAVPLAAILLALLADLERRRGGSDAPRPRTTAATVSYEEASR